MMLFIKYLVAYKFLIHYEAHEQLEYHPAGIDTHAVAYHKHGVEYA